MENKNIVQRFLLKNTAWIFLAFATVIISGYFRMYGAKVVQNIIDSLTQSEFSSIKILIIFAIASQVISYVLRYPVQIIGRYLGEKLALQTRVALYNHLNKVDYAELEKIKAGDLQSVFRNDLNMTVRFGRLAAAYLTNIFILVFSVWYLAGVDLRVTVAVIAASVLLGIFTTNLMSVIKKYETVSRKSLGNITSVIIGIYESADIIKTYGAKDYVRALFNKERNEYNRYTQKSTDTDTVRLFFFNILQYATIFGCTLYLSYRAINGEMTLGEVVVFISLLRNVLSPIDFLFKTMIHMIASLAAWDRVAKIFAMETDEAAARNLEGAKDICGVRIDHISFGYDQVNSLFKDASLHLEKGKLYALTGKSGSGKTTLLKLILGLYKSGGIEFYLSGKDGAEDGRTGGGSGERVDGILDLTSFVPSDNKLFNLSIYENIMLGKDVTKEACMDLAREIGIADWIQSLPGGLDTLIEENAQNLSGGQRQSICILRALAADKPIIIMDEPFAALDKEREGSFIEMLGRLKKDKILFITSHRESSVDKCDEVISLEA